MARFSVYMRTTVYIKQRASYTDAGEPVMGTAATVLARVDNSVRLVKNRTGELVESVARVFLDSTRTVGEGMQLSLDGTNYRDAITYVSHRDLGGVIVAYEVAI